MNTQEPIKRILAIINPGAGQEQPVLYTLNHVFADANIEWDVAITKKDGSTLREIALVVESDFDAVAVYGGDGTVTEVANALHGTSVPMAILPGGTANMLSAELGIPRKLINAAQLITDPSAHIRLVDMGCMNDQLFFHMSLGVLGNVSNQTDRAAKEQNGLFAYMLAGLQELQQLPAPTHFQLMLDEQNEVEVESIGCMITNYGKIGIANLELAHTIDLDDGIMDVMTIRDLTLPTLVKALAGAIATGEIANAFQHWRAKTVSISMAPGTPIMFDGEPFEAASESLSAQIVPGAVRIIVPA